MLGVDFEDFGVEMVVQGSFWYCRILVLSVHCLKIDMRLYNYPFFGIEV